jgi:hypothetical protein
VVGGGGGGGCGDSCEKDGGCGLFPLIVECNAADAFIVGVSSAAPVGVFVCDFLAGDGPGEGVYGPPFNISS